MPTTSTTENTVDLLQSLPQFHNRTLKSVDELHQRSHCFRFRYVDGGSVFVKRARRATSGAWTADVVREAAMLRLLQGLGAPVPAHLATIDEADVKLMVTEYYDGRSSAKGCDLFAEDDNAAWSRALGATVADIHSLSAGLDPARSTSLPRPPTVNHVALMVERILQPTPSEIAAYAGGYSELLTRIHTSGVDGALADMVNDWRADGLIHGDLKSDNMLRTEVLCATEPIILIDWELAGWGDTRWDLASLIGTCVFEWLNGVACKPTGTLQDWLAEARWPLTSVRTSVRRLVAAYSPASASTAKDRTQLMRYTSMFLFQRLMMSAMHSPRLSASALTYLQVATTLLRNPYVGLELLT